MQPHTPLMVDNKVDESNEGNNIYTFGDALTYPDITFMPPEIGTDGNVGMSVYVPLDSGSITGFSWDLNNDGTPDKTTAENSLQQTFPPGSHEVQVTVNIADSYDIVIGPINIMIREGGSVEPGDIDGSGTIGLEDAIKALQVLSGIRGNIVYSDADINDDGRIGMEEVIYILQNVMESR